jgi:2-amino-4-hydroxy-6-hydroxymethyldihydropteridine diphosphokinase
MSHFLFLGLGANLGDRKEALALARANIESMIGPICQCSSIYQTKPWGLENQNDFLNQVIKIKTAFFPFQVLEKIKEIEAKMGRVENRKWGERHIDIDILFFENFRFSSSTLTVPHPYIQSRRFVLEPLTEIAPTLVHPSFNKNVKHLLEICPDTGWVEALL